MCARVVQSCPTLYHPVDSSLPGSSAMKLFRQEYWSGLPIPTPGDLPEPGTESASLASPALAGGFLTTEPLDKSQSNPTFYLVCLEYC